MRRENFRSTGKKSAIHRRWNACFLSLTGFHIDLDWSRRWQLVPTDFPKRDASRLKHSISNMWTSSMNRTPGTNSATPWSMYLFTTLLISRRSLSIIEYNNRLACRERRSLTSDFCLFRFDQWAHDGENILSTLGSSIGHVQIVQSDILYHFFLLMNISFR